VAAFDFFFVPPYLTFAVSDTEYVVTFAVMLVVGLLISTLAVRVKDQAEAARERERRTRVLYDMSRELAARRAPEDVASVSSRHVGELFRGPAGVLLPGAASGLALVRPVPDGFPDDPRERAVAQWSFDHGRPAGLGTDTLPGAAALYLPLVGAQGTLGVLGLRPHESLRPLPRDQMDLLETLAHQAAAALDRARLATESERARLAAEAERLRSTLLSSVSHDLRTPLAAITGAASGLLQQPAAPEAVRRELTETVFEEADRLNRLVTNLLDMTRLESGSLRLNREWHSLEEVVGSALARLERALEGRKVATAIPAELPLVPMDALLVEQVLVNLVENAVKYTPPGTPVRVSASRDDGSAKIEVADEGPGLPPGTEERVFEKFQRGEGLPGGFGLGLAICRAIVTAHGGRIWAENRRPRGAAFRFTLPLGASPPSLPSEDALDDERA
jgi:two-component system sensor histidine kinase KdpD